METIKVSLIPHQEIETLRKEVKHRMVDLDLDRPGSYEAIIPRLKRPVSQKILSMALTGYRNGPAAQSLLEELRAVLQKWPHRAA
jgi:hypothetical protein